MDLIVELLSQRLAEDHGQHEDAFGAATSGDRELEVVLGVQQGGLATALKTHDRGDETLRGVVPLLHLVFHAVKYCSDPLVVDKRRVAIHQLNRRAIHELFSAEHWQAAKNVVEFSFPTNRCRVRFAEKPDQAELAEDVLKPERLNVYPVRQLVFIFFESF